MQFGLWVVTDPSTASEWVAAAASTNAAIACASEISAAKAVREKAVSASASEFRGRGRDNL